MKIKFKKLYPDAIIPSFGHDDDSNAGLDLYVRFNPAEQDALDLDGDAIVLGPGCSVKLGIGVAWEPGPLESFIHGYVGNQEVKTRYDLSAWKPALIIKGRSGLARDRGIEASNAGLVDAGYRGEIAAIIHNTSRNVFYIRNRDRIAQAVVVLLPVIEVEEAVELSESARGAKGFGSSGR